MSSAQIGRDGTLSFSWGTAAQLGQVRIRSSHDPCDEKQKRRKLEDCHKRAVPVERLQGALQGRGGVRGGFVVLTAGFGQSPSSVQVFYEKAS